MLPGAARRALQWAELVLVGGLAGFTAFHSFRYAARMYALDRRSDNAGIPMWLPHGALALGFGLICLMTLWRTARLLSGESLDPKGEGERTADDELPSQPLS
jgi:TRAP-type C4-dicarboxylate transport system permease small subunit